MRNMADNESQLSEAELEALLGTTVKNVSDMAPEGKYPVEIVDVNGYKPGKWDDHEKVESVLVFTLANLEDENATALRWRVKIYAREDGTSSLAKATIKSKWGQLLAAVWPNPKDRLGKGARDLIGEQCLAVVTHQPNPSDPSKLYAQTNLRPLT